LSAVASFFLSCVVWVQLMEDAGAGDTVSFMRKYWRDNKGRDEHFWEVWQE
jgi:hypothetical protein